jgi:DNA mismatch repair protein MutL
MAKIKILPEELVNQIAAGEVVERPASVVKELVENALDAGATFLEINIEKGGIEKIEVRDNGQGMSKEDAVLAVKRYSTSKIDSVDDLNQIKTFGFRGEALASIGSVSKFKLATKTADSVEGTQVLMEGGKQPTVSVCGHPQGTTVTVNDLFFNVPARKKFMKTPQTEFKLIREFVTGQAICHPQIGFRLIHNEREVFHLQENQNLSERLTNLLNVDLEKFIPVELEGDYFQLRGFVGLPEIARKKQSIQYLFINQRFLTNKTVVGAIYKAYQDLLPSGTKPAFILKLNIRQDLIDVNVHPRKEEVKFVSPGVIFNALQSAVYSKLNQAAETQNTVYRSPPGRTDQQSANTKKSKSYYQPPEERHRPSFSQHQEFMQSMFKDKSDNYSEVSEGDIWQIGNLYLVSQIKEGLIIYDQHAAEERILFERFKKDFLAKRGDRQELMFDEEIELNQEDIEVLKKQKNTLTAVGFDFNVKENTAVFTGVPVVLKDKNIDRVIRDYIDELKEPEEEVQIKPTEAGIDRNTLTSLAYLACRSAVKQGDKLAPPKRRQVIDKVAKLGVKGMTCPHGRPTYIKISLANLNKRFHRQ